MAYGSSSFPSSLNILCFFVSNILCQSLEMYYWNLDSMSFILYLSSVFVISKVFRFIIMNRCPMIYARANMNVGSEEDNYFLQFTKMRKRKRCTVDIKRNRNKAINCNWMKRRNDALSTNGWMKLENDYFSSRRRRRRVFPFAEMNTKGMNQQRTQCISFIIYYYHCVWYDVAVATFNQSECKKGYAQ